MRSKISLNSASYLVQRSSPVNDARVKSILGTNAWNTAESSSCTKLIQISRINLHASLPNSRQNSCIPADTHFLTPGASSSAIDLTNAIRAGNFLLDISRFEDEASLRFSDDCDEMEAGGLRVDAGD